MLNKQVAEIFQDIAKILELKGENVFRIRAYERAAINIETLNEDIKIISEQNRLKEIPGIGDDLAEKIKEIVKTGKLIFLDQLKKTLPGGLLDLLNIPGLGPKKVKLFYDKLNIKNISDLEKQISATNRGGSASGGKNQGLLSLPGIREKTIANISKGIQILKKGRERILLSEAINIADEVISRLKETCGVKKITPAGSLRRCKETVRDIDILAISAKPELITNTFIKLPNISKVLVRGQTKSSILIKDKVQIDLRVLEDKSYGAALVYFTGSKEFNIKLRQLAIKKKLKINEYGIFSSNGRRLGGKTEFEIFKILGLKYIEPELREDRGEIEAAANNGLPNLIELKDIKGDFHIHSSWSDGLSTIEQMAQACQELGYKYMASTDHSQGLKVAKGLSIKKLMEKKNEIEKLNKTFKDFKIIFATEVDIDSSGKIDYPDEILKEFDIVVAAIHTGFKQQKQQLTKRIIRACFNKYVHIIAHPTGRLWGQRDSYDIDFEEIFKACLDTNTALEINAFPTRLDLNDINAKMAKEKNVMLALGSDSHNYKQLSAMKFGVMVARRAWLEKKDILNTLELNELLKRIKK